MPETPTRMARHSMIIRLVERHDVTSQAQLSALLKEVGVKVAQSTLSRDLEELGVRKVKNAAGHAVYMQREADAALHCAGPRERLRKLVARTMIGLEVVNFGVLLRTPPGAAQYLASGIDTAGLPEVVGTIAGDDTILVLAREPMTGKDLREVFIH
ncbi:hypothetical protein [Corynebacterium oculi]|nr:hypothetical protein [Corynebacterium oculi]